MQRLSDNKWQVRELNSPISNQTTPMGANIQNYVIILVSSHYAPYNL